LLSKVPIALTEIKEWSAIFALYEKNFRIVYGLKQRQTCQERRLVLEDGVPKLKRHE
jgi:hypothetical protein